MLIRIVDTETTGLDPENDRVVEVAAWNLDSVTGVITARYEMLHSPGFPIPPEASAIHHITDDIVDGMSPLGRDWAEPRVDAYCAHNAAFDKQFLEVEQPWICTKKVAYRVWPEAPGHSNQVLRYWLKLDIPIFIKAIMPHRAVHDAYVTASILREALKSISVETALEISSQPAILPKCYFGKHQGKFWRDIPKDYLSWCVKQDMDEDVLHTCRYWLGQ